MRKCCAWVSFAVANLPAPFMSLDYGLETERNGNTGGKLREGWKLGVSMKFKNSGSSRKIDNKVYL